MKKKRKLLLCLLTLALAVPAAADETEYTDANGVEYTISNGEATVEGLSESFSGTELTIPATANSATVTKIANKAFVAEESITSVIVEAENLTVGQNAFLACTGITAVTVQESGSIKEVGKQAFSTCTNLESINLTGTTAIGESAFLGCALTEVEATSAINVEATAFSGCSSLETLKLSALKEIPAGLFSGLTALETIDVSAATEIPASAFAGLQNLTTVTLNTTEGEDSGVTIGESAFANCAALSGITLTNVTIIGENAFYGTGLTGGLDLSHATNVGANAFYNTGITSVTLSDSAEVSAGAFGLCLSLTTVEGKPSKVGGSAFANCTALTTVDLSSATSIGESAFANCSSLTGELDLKDNVTLGASAFYSTGLTSVSVNTETISESAFANCTSLTSLILGSNVTTINANAFAGCSGIEEIEIPAGLTTIGASAFSGCSRLATIDATNTTSAATCGDGAFEGVAEGCEVLVSSSDVAALYKAADEWKGLNIRAEDLTITIGSAGYATYYSNSEYILPEDFEAATVYVNDEGELVRVWQFGSETYTQTNDSGTEITYEQSNVIPAGTAILIRYIGEDESETTHTATCETQTASGTAITGQNMLHGSESAVSADYMTSITASDSGSGDYYYYSLGYDTSKTTLGFYWYNSDGSAFTLGANKAWLAVPQNLISTDSGAKALGFAFEGTGNTTGIEAVENGATETTGSDVIYNLQGVRVNDMSQKGVYIVNGKKVVKR